VKRREFFAGLGSAAVSPLVARAQRPKVPVVGLDFGASETTNLTAFREGLSEVGFIEGSNLAIEYRFADGDVVRLRELAADLVRRRVAVVAAWSGSEVARAVRAASTTIPIVFQTGDDPVQAGLATSLNRPGGNITGVTSMNVEILAKRVELLHRMVPGPGPMALLIKPLVSNKELGPSIELLVQAAQTAAASLGRPIEVLTADTNVGIDAAFAVLAQKRIGALLIAPQALFANRAVQIATLAARHAVPTSSFYRGFAEAGGLMTYGLKSYDDLHHQGGIYVGRILKGEKPADLPVVQPTKFELVINLNTARALGLTIPETILATADEVIQ
jgi:putative ABC transport system substrate-binding protein